MTSRQSWDAVVVGGGLVGSSVAYRLAVDPRLAEFSPSRAFTKRKN